MNILAMDTAMNALSVALAQQVAGAAPVIHGHFEILNRGHAEALATRIEQLLGKADIQPGALDQLLVTIGPGSFTGTRIALSLARAMAATLDIPARGLTTLHAIAANAASDQSLSNQSASDQPIAVLADARKGEIYHQSFAPDLTPLTEPALASPQAAAAALPAGARLIGTGAAVVLDQCSSRGNFVISTASPDPDARQFVTLAITNPATLAPPHPLYLRPPDAKLPATPALWQKP